MRGNITHSTLTGSMEGKTVADLKTAMNNGDTCMNVLPKTILMEKSEDK